MEPPKRFGGDLLGASEIAGDPVEEPRQTAISCGKERIEVAASLFRSRGRARRSRTLITRWSNDAHAENVTLSLDECRNGHAPGWVLLSDFGKQQIMAFETKIVTKRISVDYPRLMAWCLPDLGARRRPHWKLAEMIV